MKGYPTIIKRQQKRFLSYFNSKTHDNAHWEPKYKGAKEYELNGHEVERGLKTIYRVVWNVSYRDENGTVKKKQTQIANIQYWDIVEEFKEFLLYRQGKLEGKNEGSIMLNKSHLPGEVEGLKEAVSDFVYDQLDERLYDPIEKKLFDGGKTGTRDDWDSMTAKLLKKWGPIKTVIINEYLASHEFQVWLSNEAMRKAGPRKPTEEELRDQQESEESFNRFKKAFEGSFSGSGGTGGSDYGDRGYGGATYGRPDNGSITDRALALEIVKAGYKRLSRIYHPDVGGSDESMKALNLAKEELDQLFS